MAAGEGLHDRLFKAMVSDPETSRWLVREHLPGEVVAELAEGPPLMVEAGFVDPELRVSQSDALLHLRLRGGGELGVYCLVEHKSVPEPWLALQLLRYLERAWDRQRREGAASGRLAAIIPLVVYNGARPWAAPRRFSGLVEAPEAVRRHVLDFQYQVLDVGQGDEGSLSAYGVLRALLRILKYGTREFSRPGDDLRTLLAVLRDLGAAPPFLWEVALTYVHRQWAMDKPTVRAARVLVAQEQASDEVQRMTTMAEHLESFGEKRGLALGRKQGRQEGRQEGRVEAQRVLLERIVTRRFAIAAEALALRLAGASPAQVEVWLDRAIDAERLEDIFGDTSAPPR